MHVIFESRHEPEVIGLLHRDAAVHDYLRLDGVCVSREVERQDRRAYRSDNRNSLISIICADDIADRILHGVAALRGRLGCGVRAYAMPADEA